MEVELSRGPSGGASVDSHRLTSLDPSTNWESANRTLEAKSVATASKKTLHRKQQYLSTTTPSSTVLPLGEDNIYHCHQCIMIAPIIDAVL